MNDTADFLTLLHRDGVVRNGDARLTPLTGGVSSEIYVVDDGSERFVVKRALAKLKVKADWFANVDRNRYEWEFIRYVARFRPDAVPALRHCSAAGNYFVMEFLSDQLQNWKQRLLAGHADLEYAARAGDLLAQIHRHSAGDAEARSLFDTTANFSQLRIEPYLLAAGAKHPALQPLFDAEAARLEKARECLVHGDFSPKNMLVSGERMVLLDCEVAWYGDAAFDPAFFLTHLFLKELWHRPRQAGMRRMVDEFWSAYLAARPVPDLDQRVARLLLMLLLARVDGKSPVEYLDSVRQDFVRQFVQETLPSDIASVSVAADSWFSRLQHFVT